MAVGMIEDMIEEATIEATIEANILNPFIKKMVITNKESITVMATTVTMGM
jgi:hypothetical protein